MIRNEMLTSTLIQLVKLLLLLNAQWVIAQDACEVSNLGENPPIVNVKENVSVGELIFGLSYTPKNAVVKLTEIGGANELSDHYKDKFSLSYSSGTFTIRVNGALYLPDYPSTAQRAFLPVKVSCNGQLSQTVAIINVINVNNQAPEFFGTPYLIKISEATQVGSLIDTPVVAIDWDPAPSYMVDFNITNFDAINGTFAIAPANGQLSRNIDQLDLPLERRKSKSFVPEQLPTVVRLKLMKPLDFDNGTAQFLLNISAQDRKSDNDSAVNLGWSYLVIEVLDADDLPPQFSATSYRGNITLDAVLNSYVMMQEPLYAIDGDANFNAKILYSLEPSKGTEYFAVDNNGGIYVWQEFEKGAMPKSFDLTVKAEQRSNRNQFSLVSVHIDIISINQYSPSFDPCDYIADVFENSKVGTFVQQVTAVDPDTGDYGEFVYEIVNSSTSAFEVNSESGIIKVRNATSLDREQTSRITIKVTVRPKTHVADDIRIVPAKCPVATLAVNILDENDNAPVLAKSTYVFVVSDKIASNSAIGTVTAHDPDQNKNAEIEFVELNQDKIGDQQPRFSLNNLNNGSAEIVVYFTVLKPIFYDSYQLTFLVRDRGDNPRNSVGKIQIKVNRTNSDVVEFEKALYTKTIQENLPFGTSILQVKALNTGDKRLPLRLNSTYNNTFSLDPQSGWISVGNEMGLDYEYEHTYVLLITAENQLPRNVVASVSNKTATIVRINLEDVNDNEPQFIGTDNGTFDFFISDIFQKDKFIGKIEAIDADRNAKGIVKLIPVSIPIYFALNSDGTLTWQKPLPDRAESVYTLVIEANDDDRPSRSAIATVNIHVQKLSQFGPLFINLPKTYPVSEASPIGSAIYTISVEDKDTANSDVLLSIVDGNIDTTFGLDGNVVKLLKPLDAEYIQAYNLVISAFDGIESVNSTLDLLVQDVNDFTPVFEIEKYEFFIESFEKGTSVGRVKASDSDLTAPNNLIFYTIEENNVFKIDSDMGEITAKSKPSPGSPKEYLMVVQAKDQGHPALKSFVVVKIKTGDSNIPPKFTYSTYNALVPENLAPIALLKLEARHPSLPVIYSINTTSAMVRNLIDINPTTGEVVLKQPLDYESKPHRVIQAIACVYPAASDENYTDSSSSLCDRTVMYINVTDMNDNAPVFRDSIYETQISRDIEVGAEILTVAATDSDHGAAGMVTYSISSFGIGRFRIDPRSGVIQLAEELPTEQDVISQGKWTDEYRIMVEAFDAGVPSLSSSVTVIIKLNNSNANAPIFDQFLYTIRISENSPIGAFIIDLNASDADNDILFYSLKNGAAHFFHIDSNSGVITTKEVLDYEKQTKFDLVIEAVDINSKFPRSSSTVVQIEVLDQNDNSPVFQPLPDRILISETKSEGTDIIVLIAYDDDSGMNGNNNVSYDIVPKNEFFGIAGDQNWLRVQKNLIPGTYDLTLVASDGGDPPQSAIHEMTIIVMPKNSLYPVFEKLSYSIFLTAHNMTVLPAVVAKLELLNPSMNIQYSLLPASINNDLHIDETTGEIVAEPTVLSTLKSHRRLYVIVRATNTKNPKYFSDISLHIDADKSIFRQNIIDFPASLYRASIAENEGANTSLGIRVTSLASPDLGRIYYWLKPNDTFTITQDGIIVARKSIDLEALEAWRKGVYKLKVFVSNGTSTSSTNLEIKINDVNEFFPKFVKSEFSASVSEDLPEGSTILDISAVDADYTDSNLKFFLDPDDPSAEKFIRIVGNKVVKTGRSFDREKIAHYNFKVGVSDHFGNTDLATISLDITDINDNAPIFIGGSQFEWIVPENTINVEPFKLEALDMDIGSNDRIEFTLLHGNESGAFELKDLGHGQCQLTLRDTLDREVEETIFLTIQARDNGSPAQLSLATVQVTIEDTNDMPPVFHRKIYETAVPSDFLPGFSVIVVYAIDGDSSSSNLTYSFASDNSSGYFDMNSKTGEISLRKYLPESNMTFALEIEVSDGKFIDKNMVIIRVVHPNDRSSPTVLKGNKAPHFEKRFYNFTVKEGQDQTRIGMVKFEDEDSKKVKLLIQPESFRAIFRISNESGEIYSRKKMVFSAGLDVYTFIVSAQDDGDPPLRDLTEVTVTVQDINDNAPLFLQDSYTAKVPYNVKNGVTIDLDIKAKDADAGYNAEILYTTKSDDKYIRDCFDIDPKTAKIRFTCEPSNLERRLFHFQIIATDKNGKGLSSSASVTVTFDGAPSTTSTSTALPKLTTALILPKTDSITTTISTSTSSTSTSTSTASTPQLSTPTPSASTSTRESHQSPSTELFIMNFTSLGTTEISRTEVSAVFNSDASIFVPASTQPLSTPRSTQTSSTSTVDSTSRSQSTVGTTDSAVVRTKISTALNRDTSSVFVPVSVLPDTATKPIKTPTSTVASTSRIQSVTDVFIMNVSTKLSTENVTRSVGMTKSLQNITFITVSPPLKTTPVASTGSSATSTTSPATFIWRSATSTWRSATSTRRSTAVDRESSAFVPVSTLPITQSIVSETTASATSPFTSAKWPSSQKQHSTPISTSILTSTSTPASTWSITRESIPTPAQIRTTTTIRTFVTASVLTVDQRCIPTFNHIKPYKLLVSSPSKTIVFAPEETKSIPEVCTLRFSLEGRVALLKYFSLDPETGLIETNDPVNVTDLIQSGVLDIADRIIELKLRIVAQGGLRIPESQIPKVRIELVDDPNQKMVRFGDPKYSFVVWDNTPKNSVIGELVTNNIVNTSSLTYQLLLTDYFEIDPQTTEIRTTKTLKSAQLTSKDLIFVLKVTDRAGNYDFAKIEINIKDNESTLGPQFVQKFQYFELPEAPYGTGVVVGRIVATLPPRSLAHGIIYSIMEFGVPFRINRETGEIQVFGNIDREAQNAYQFTVIASDDSRPPKKSIAKIQYQIIDVNDNSPIFVGTPKVISLRGNTAPGTEIGSVFAMDIDAGANARIVYKLVSSSVPYFRIGSKDGILTTNATVPYNPQANSYTIVVRAHDLGRPYRDNAVAIQIEVFPDKQKIPEFKSKSANITAPLLVEDIVDLIQVTAGPSDANILYEIRKGNVENLFGINSTSGLISIIRKPTEAERGRPYQLTISARNLTNAQSDYLNLQVVIPSDTTASPNYDRSTPRTMTYPPGTGITSVATHSHVETTPGTSTFPIRSFVIDVEENQMSPLLIIDVNSTYEQRGIPVAYRIITGADQSFEIDNVTGAIFATKALDREKKPHYVMVVEAVPVLDHLRHHIRKLRQLVRTRRRTHSRSRYSGRLRFETADNPGKTRHHARQVDRPLLTQSAPLSWAELLNLKFNEVAVVVNISDVNDNPPRFIQDPYGVVLTMQPDTGIGKLIGSVKAADADLTSKLEYSIISNSIDDSYKFRINPNSGAIMAARDFRKARKKQFGFDVQASDGSFTAVTNVIVYKLSPTMQALLRSSEKTEFVRWYSTEIEKKLSGFTGWNVTVSGLSPRLYHKGYIDKNRTDVYIYAIDPLSRRPVATVDLVNRINEVFPEVQQQLGFLRLESVAELAESKSSEQDDVGKMSIAESALIAVSAVIIVAAMVGTVLLFQWWRRKEKHRLLKDQLPSDHDSYHKEFYVTGTSSSRGTADDKSSVYTTGTQDPGSNSNSNRNSPPVDPVMDHTSSVAAKAMNTDIEFAHSMLDRRDRVDKEYFDPIIRPIKHRHHHLNNDVRSQRLSSYHQNERQLQTRQAPPIMMSDSRF